ncbi:MAG: hypothetical protein WCF04_11870 [Candidatus Nanopelagicales bacterium]
MARPAERSLLMGWLYADLLLVLLIAALGGISLPGSERPGSERESSDAHPQGLDPNPLLLSIDVDSLDLLHGRRAVERRFQRDFSVELTSALAERGLSIDESRVGFAITFGFNRQIGTAQRIAAAANEQARVAQERALQGATMKDYGNRGAREDPNHVTFEIFLVR